MLLIKVAAAVVQQEDMALPAKVAAVAEKVATVPQLIAPVVLEDVRMVLAVAVAYFMHILGQIIIYTEQEVAVELVYMDGLDVDQPHLQQAGEGTV
jgi:hypothetical protein